MSEYRVLARKYRPQSFDDLVGQDVLVRTLSNAIKNDRIAHAFLLTGIRGIGKTTTARIIARALNCIGEDGQGGATISPCGVCPNCTQIREDRHVDVMEMDAASRTGVGDIRDLIETVHYAPTNARSKIYIIDEVHMLSTSAFNALLKTLEEPPPHVIFIFATTELRKIPVTILSRCQRFDLKRLDVDMLTTHLSNICAKEGITAEEEGLRLIAMSAEGSVRDGLSLLDRAISHGFDDDGNALPVTCEAVRGMLGLADRTQIFNLLEVLFGGQVTQALDALGQQYADGSDVTLLLQDMLAVVHMITRLRIDANDDLGPTYSDTEKEYAKKLADKLSVASLSRAWQMLLKGVDEVRTAPDTLMAAEMVLIRFAHAAELPSPAELVKKIKETQASAPIGGGAPAGGAPMGGGAGGSAPMQSGPSGGAPVHAPTMAVATQPIAAVSTQPEMRVAPTHLTLAANNPVIELGSFEEVVDYLREQREARLRHVLEHDVALISFEVGTITLKNVGNPAPNLPREVAKVLQYATGNAWQINFAEGDAAPTLAEQAAIAKAAELEEVRQHPIVSTILETFDGSRLEKIIHDTTE